MSIQYLHTHNSILMNARLLLSIASMAFFGLVSPSAVSAQTKSPDAIEVVFTPNTSEVELQRIQDRMKNQDVELTYTDLQYKEGKLQSLSFKLVTKVGEGTASGSVQEGKRFGFYFDPSTPRSDKASFIVGELPNW